MAERYVLNAHAWLWYVTDDPNLGQQAGELLDALEPGLREAIVPTIALAELVYLLKKAERQTELDMLLARAESTEGLFVAPLDMEVIREAAAIPAVLELHDRIIVATTRLYGAVLITADREIQESGLVDTVW